MDDPFSSPSSAWWSAPKQPETFEVESMPLGMVECRPYSLLDGGGGDVHVWLRVVSGPEKGATFRSPLKHLSAEAQTIARRVCGVSA